MGWSIVNVRLQSNDAIRGKDAASRAAVKAILDDGYEPFSTAGIGDSLIMSFRRWSDDGESSFDNLGDLPGV